MKRIPAGDVVEAVMGVLNRRPVQI